MPLMKLCPRCQKKIPYELKYCEECTKKVDEQQKQIYKDYRVNRNDKDIQKIYVSKRWEKVKGVVKHYQNGLDLYSYYVLGIVEYAEKYHHIIEVKEDTSKAYDINNIIGLTDSNHKLVHNAYDRSIEDKKAMQEFLFGLLDRYKKEFG